MQILNYQVGFNTPAFLGNAQQEGQWRTPPFKALLRQWWRIVKARQVGFDYRELLQEENALFGSAGDDKGGGRSRVQLRLSRWELGGLAALPRMLEIVHPEVSRKVDAGLYLGFGPVTVKATRTAIEPDGTSASLQLRCPLSAVADLRKAVQLMAWFGSLGSRARNGWGSLNLQGDGVLGLENLCDSTLAAQALTRPLSEALKDRSAGEWPHALGQCEDGRPAIWRAIDRVQRNSDGTGAYLGFDRWQGVMEHLAELKIGFRNQFKFKSGGPHAQVEDRHVLAYPVTHHELAGLPNARMANQLRFKVARNKAGQYFGVIVHLPCAMPASLFDTSNLRPPEIERQIVIWRKVHEFLSAQQQSLVRIRKG